MLLDHGNSAQKPNAGNRLHPRDFLLLKFCLCGPGVVRYLRVAIVERLILGPHALPDRGKAQQDSRRGEMFHMALRPGRVQQIHKREERGIDRSNEPFVIEKLTRRPGLISILRTAFEPGYTHHLREIYPQWGIGVSMMKASASTNVPSIPCQRWRPSVPAIIPHPKTPIVQASNHKRFTNQPSRSLSRWVRYTSAW